MKRSSTQQHCSKLLLSFLFLFFNVGLFAQLKIGDNLGNHKAVSDLNMNSKNVVNAAGLVIGQATFTNSSIILDLNSATKAMVVPRLTDIKSLPAADVVNGMMAYDVLTNKFYIRENGVWSTFGSFKLEPTKILVGNKAGLAEAIAIQGDVTIGIHPDDLLLPAADQVYKTRIDNNKVTVKMLRTDPLIDINKVYATSLLGIPELINKSDLAIPKFTTAQRDLTYPASSPAPDNTIIYNTTLRLLQIFNASIPPAPGAWVAPGTPSESNLPVVSTALIEAVSAKPDTAFSGGSVISAGATAVTARGVCWKTTSSPSVTDFATVDGSGIGSFSSILYGLIPNTTYYVRAYATNGSGTTYGQEVTFTSGSAKVPVLAKTTIATAVSNNSARSGGDITNAKGANILTKGIVWSTSTAPVIALSTKTSEIVTAPGTGAFVSDLTNLQASTQYFVRSYASNSVGVNYGEEITFTTLPANAPTVETTAVSQVGVAVSSGGNVTLNGGASVSAKGVVWSTISPPTISNSKTIDGSGLGTFTSNLSSITAGTTYYVRAYATNSSGTGYGEVLNFVANAKPVMGPSSFVSVTNTSAVLTSNVVNDGGQTATRGIVWSTASGALYNASNTTTQTSNGTGAGTYSSNLSGLTALTTYYVRSYAVNASGVSYGAEITFTTSGTTNISTFADVTVTIPVGITSVNARIYGAVGGGSGGGLGGYTSVNIPVVGGQVLLLTPGAAGVAGTSGAVTSAAKNGGGRGSDDSGGGGGGYSAVYYQGVLTAVAGGGGGYNAGTGKGNGGGLNGEAGTNIQGMGGGGGTQSAGGTSGVTYSGVVASGYLQGGQTNPTTYGGGGGGGYYGGGAGNSAGGGGGSGFIRSSATGSMTNGVNNSNGYIILSYL